MGDKGIGADDADVREIPAWVPESLNLHRINIPNNTIRYLGSIIRPFQHLRLALFMGSTTLKMTRTPWSSQLQPPA